MENCLVGFIEKCLVAMVVVVFVLDVTFNIFSVISRQSYYIAHRQTALHSLPTV